MASPVVEELASVRTQFGKDRTLAVLQELSRLALAPLGADGAVADAAPTLGNPVSLVDSGEVSVPCNEPYTTIGHNVDHTDGRCADAMYAELSTFARHLHADIASAVEGLEGRLRAEVSNFKVKIERDVSSLELVLERQQAALEALDTKAGNAAGLEERVTELCTLLSEQRSMQEERSNDLHQAVVGFGSRLNERLKESTCKEGLIARASIADNKTWSPLPMPAIRSPRVQVLSLDGCSQGTPRAVEPLTRAITTDTPRGGMAMTKQQASLCVARSVSSSVPCVAMAADPVACCSAKGCSAAIVTATSPPILALHTPPACLQARTSSGATTPRLPNTKDSALISTPSGSRSVITPARSRAGFASPISPPMSGQAGADTASRDMSPTPPHVATTVPRGCAPVRLSAEANGALLPAQGRVSPVRSRTEANVAVTPRSGAWSQDLQLSPGQSGVDIAARVMNPTAPCWASTPEARIGRFTQVMGAMPTNSQGCSPVRLRAEANVAVALRADVSSQDLPLSPGQSGADIGGLPPNSQGQSGSDIKLPARELSPTAESRFRDFGGLPPNSRGVREALAAVTTPRGISSQDSALSPGQSGARNSPTPPRARGVARHFEPWHHHDGTAEPPALSRGCSPPRFRAEASGMASDGSNSWWGPESERQRFGGGNIALSPRSAETARQRHACW